MWRWSVSRLRKLSYNPRCAFQQWNKGWTRDKKLKKAPVWMSLMLGSHWRDLSVQFKWLVFIVIGGIYLTKKSEELRHYNRFQTAAWKRYFQIDVQAKRFDFGGWVMIGVFWKKESRPILWPQSRLFTRQLYSCLRIVYEWREPTFWKIYRLSFDKYKSELFLK